MGTIRVVVFDLVGTLIFPQPSVAEVYQRFGVRHGSGYTSAELGHRFRLQYQRTDWSDASEVGQRDAWRQLVDKVFDDVDGSGDLFDALWQHFASASAWRFFSDVEGTLTSLRRLGLHMVVGSNFDRRITALCQDLGLSEQMDAIWGSVDLLVAKPQAAFFEQICQRLQIPPGQILMVGDDYQRDYQAALAAGWQARWLNRSGVEVPAGCEQVTTLADIPGLLRDIESFGDL